jgi:DNA-binding response OmpR family regulator
METQPTLLVVDDNEALVSIIGEVLAFKTKFRVLRALTAKAARKLLETENIDVMVADVILGADASGIDLCIEAMHRHENIAVVLISGDDMQDVSRYPATAQCLQKPFSASELLAAIKQARDRASL